MGENILLAAVIVIILLIFFHISRQERETDGDPWTGSSDYGIIGQGLPSVYDSGADLRFATELTSTDEQPYSTPYVKDVVSMAKLLQNEGNERMSSIAGNERMTGNKQKKMSERMTNDAGTGVSGHMYMCPCSRCGGQTVESMRGNDASVRLASGSIERLVGNGTFPAFFETSRQFGDYREADREKYFGQV